MSTSARLHPNALTSAATLLEVPHPKSTRAGRALYTKGCILNYVAEGRDSEGAQRRSIPEKEDRSRIRREGI